MFHTTPEAITDEVLTFCRSVSRHHEPVFLDVVPRAGAVAGHCFTNTEDFVATFGGKQVLGWIIWYRPGIYIEAEHHAVWLNEAGELVDGTPVPSGEQRILFLRDDTAIPHVEIGLNNRRKALGGDPLVKAWITAATKENHLRICSMRGMAVDYRKLQKVLIALNDTQMDVVAKYGNLP